MSLYVTHDTRQMALQQKKGKKKQINKNIIYFHWRDRNQEPRTRLEERGSTVKGKEQSNPEPCLCPWCLKRLCIWDERLHKKHKCSRKTQWKYSDPSLRQRSSACCSASWLANGTVNHCAVSPVQDRKPSALTSLRKSKKKSKKTKTFDISSAKPKTNLN